MTVDPIQAQTCALAAALMGLPGLDADATRANTPAWDSLRHIHLVMALEDHFRIRFEDAELVGLDSIPALVVTIKKLLP